MKRILVIDGQGGKIGRALIEEIKKRDAAAEITAVGTNTAATAAMLKGGADQAATGENAVIVNCRHADYIAGPIGIVIADALLGEITPRMAQAVGQSEAVKVLIPINKCNHYVAGTGNLPASELISLAVDRICAIPGKNAE